MAKQSKRTRPSEPAKIVCLPYAALKRGDDLSAKIEEAFGFDGLGILTVSDVPGLAEARSTLLPLAPAFAALPDGVKSKYEDPTSFYSVGWSHGREKLQGRPDFSKGSYYANPLHNAPFSDPKVIEQYPSFAAPNIWPEELPQLEPAFMHAGQLIHKVGQLVAAQCDRYVHKHCASYPSTQFADLLKTSKVCKARLLHYFPTEGPAAGEELSEEEAFSNWCVPSPPYHPVALTADDVAGLPRLLHPGLLPLVAHPPPLRLLRRRQHTHSRHTRGHMARRHLQRLLHRSLLLRRAWCSGEG